MVGGGAFAMQGAAHGSAPVTRAVPLIPHARRGQRRAQNPARLGRDHRALIPVP
jgi:hypothetical protein